MRESRETSQGGLRRTAVRRPRPWPPRRRLRLDIAAGGVFLAALAAVVWPGFAAHVHGQLVQGRPDALKDVGIDEKLDALVPLDLTFLDENGKTARLGDFFVGQRPVILSLTYSACPMLCHLQLQGLVDALREMTWSPGEQFEIVNVSIDPNERWQQARKTKQKHIEAYGRPGTETGWHCLVGKNVTPLADAVGFRYQYVPEQDQYVHQAALMVCTPDGRVSRYLYGVQFDPRTLKLALVEAGEGKVGSTLDRVLLFCYHYDAETGKYGLVARRIMQLGAGLTLAALLMGLTPYWIRRRREGRNGQAKAADSSQENDETSGATSAPLDSDTA